MKRVILSFLHQSSHLTYFDKSQKCCANKFNLRNVPLRNRRTLKNVKFHIFKHIRTTIGRTVYYWITQHLSDKNTSFCNTWIHDSSPALGDTRQSVNRIRTNTIIENIMQHKYATWFVSKNWQVFLSYQTILNLIKMTLPARCFWSESLCHGVSWLYYIT